MIFPQSISLTKSYRILPVAFLWLIVNRYESFLFGATMALQQLKPRLKPSQNHQPKSRWGSGRGGRPWRRLRDQILLRDLYTCQHCRQVFEPKDLVCDHIVNSAQGGTDDPTNLQTLCNPCHDKKTHAESMAGGIKKL